MQNNFNGKKYHFDFLLQIYHEATQPNMNTAILCIPNAAEYILYLVHLYEYWNALKYINPKQNAN